MADTCIVCLGDLRLDVDDDPPNLGVFVAADAMSEEDTKDTALKIESLSHLGTNFRSWTARMISKEDFRRIELGRSRIEDEIIAHLLPCKHDLHNSCLRPWVERANSCPICRATFNMVELSHSVGGTAFDSYAVQDKVQEAELDPTMVVEDELFAVETFEPCIVCGVTDDTHERMFCDSCDKAVHIFCAGYEDSPEIWYCEGCLAALDTRSGQSLTRRSIRSGRPSQRIGTRRTNDAIWARVWQEVSSRLDLDLDFPFDDEPQEARRTEEQRRELQRWEERLQVASGQGATARLREIAASQLEPRGLVVQPAPESQEEIRAWNAFDKARETREAPASIQRRKRRATDSPASQQEDDAAEEPQLKRPRLRRRPLAPENLTTAESSTAATGNNEDRSTFLSSLLRDVETKPASAASPTATDQPTGAFSPRNSSPVRSPISSGHATPRQLSVTPPPQRPMSPPLSSTIVPMSSPIGLTFSPFSPSVPTVLHEQMTMRQERGLRRRDHDSDDSRGPSPSRAISYSTKEEIQRMVKIPLRNKYREQQINKDQYTEINRDVSRKMYEMIGDASALANEAEREKWQRIAEEAVTKAIAALPSGSCASGSETCASDKEGVEHK